ncbi:unnamed protein product [Brassicogethes aeneus]|uniref:Uncharacterized protein n=1 Tax=Brassicogethes aeneus TaxID=1431903 RepID=A0A9P0B5N4_BRAAE|nr:unnamed protein product [Brassicogethes aeneus]
MISRKEYILYRPWQERKYENHRRKVQSAVAAIDNKPPLIRQHVNAKLKKQQREKERILKIERENFLLLQRLNSVTKKNRVDNHWKTPQPGFLNRIALYNNYYKYDDDDDSNFFDSPTSSHIRMSKCCACTPKKIKEIEIPEDRIPWESEKNPIGRRRSKSVPAKKINLPEIKEEPQKRPKTTSHKCLKINNKIGDFNDNLQSLVITRGCLKLCVNFPSDTTVKFKQGNSERVLHGGWCCCKALTGLK